MSRRPHQVSDSKSQHQRGPRRTRAFWEDFIITTEGELAQAPATIQPLHSTSLDVVVEALEELQLHAAEACVPRSGRLLDFDYRRLERQLDAFLGP